MDGLIGYIYKYICNAFFKLKIDIWAKLGK